jgi:hypothetical protein
MNKIISPLSVPVKGRTARGKKKKFILNLNNYRNASYFELAEAKRNYAKEIEEQVAKLRGWDSVSIRFTLYPGSRRRIDSSNVCSIHDKFLLDALVTQGKLPDDDRKHIKHTSYYPGPVDSGNGRVEVEFINEDK